MLTRWLAKVISLIIMFVLPFFFTLLPMKVSGIFAKKGAVGRKILSCLMCFGGGVFLATYLLHMAPESRDLIHKNVQIPYGIDYPVADLLMGAGFFLVLYIEKIVIKINKKRQKRKLRQRREQCMQFNKLAQYPINVNKNSSDGLLACNVCQGKCDCEGGAVNNGNGVVANGNVPKQCPLLGTGECCNDPVELRPQDVGNDLNDEESMTMIVAVRQSQKIDETEEVEAHNTRSLVLLLALSLHRIFEGMTLGLQQNVGHVFSLLGAVMCHEVVIGFSLGLQFVKNNLTTRRTLLSCFLVSLILPIGASLGMLVVEFGAPGRPLNITNGVLQSVATGTFIYVTFFEILQEEIGPHDTSIAKISSVLVGFVAMAILNLIPEKTSEAGQDLILHNYTATIEPIESLFTTAAVVLP